MRLCNICSRDICSPLFWDICSPYFGTFALPYFGHLLSGHLLSDIYSPLFWDICSPSQFCSSTKADLDSASMDDLKKICQHYFDKWYSLEGEKFFLQRKVILCNLQINKLTISVSDMKGKFVKYTLKKVSKYENKFAKLQEKVAKFAFGNQLQINELTISVSDIKGNFIKPTLTKVSKYENNFAKLENKEEH